MFRIGEFSKMSRVAVKNLRYYDEIGLLKPEYIDPETNYRFYTSKQLVPTVVSVMHKGRYDDLGIPYAYAVKWYENNGYMMADNPREIYIDGIWNEEDENNWLTEIQIPVIK